MGGSAFGWKNKIWVRGAGEKPCGKTRVRWLGGPGLGPAVWKLKEKIKGWYVEKTQWENPAKKSVPARVVIKKNDKKIYFGGIFCAPWFINVVGGCALVLKSYDLE